MDIAKGLIILVLGLILVYLIVFFFNMPEVTVAFSVIYLAAVIAAKSSDSNKKG